MRKLVVKSWLASDASVEDDLSKIGLELSPAVWQHERVYLHRGYRPRMNFPRMTMRTELSAPDQPAEYSILLKRHIEDSGIDWEDKSKILDYPAMTSMIHQLGFQKTAEVSRQRRSLMIDTNTQLHLDLIEGLDGCYLKIEAILQEDEHIEQVRDELYKSLTMLGLETFLLQTYAELLSGEPPQFYELPATQD